MRLARKRLIPHVVLPGEEIRFDRDRAGEVADFHSLRHTYISRLVAGNASVKVCQELARHSTPTLTTGRYAHARLHDLTGALDSLPGVGDDSTQDKEASATG